MELKETSPDLTQKVVRAFVRGVTFVKENPDESAQIASRYIGINAEFIRKALNVNKPNVDAIRNKRAMEGVLSLMMKLSYIEKLPTNFSDLNFLDKAIKDLS